MRIGRWLAGLAALVAGRRLRRALDGDGDGDGRIVAAGTPDRSAENIVLALLAAASLLAIAFVVVYAVYAPPRIPNQLLGVTLGGSLACVAAALAVVARRLVVTEELEEDYPPERHPDAEAAVVAMVGESGSRFTRKRLMIGAGAATGGALGMAALAPVLSLGPVWDTKPLYETPWRRGVRLVDKDGRTYRAQEIEQETFYTAFPAGADEDLIGAPVVVVRLDPAALRLPAERAAWAPGGIVAYSKICTHAACAIALYRKPTFTPLEPGPALVCPCHYSTFDPATGGTVIYGPAGRPLPQLPLVVDAAGLLRAAGNFSGPVGPSWWGVRDGGAA